MSPALFLSAALVLGAEYQEGSILVLHNSNKVVGVATDSTVTHVAMLMRYNGKTYVYEATPDQVRRVPLSTYYHEIGELNQRRSRPMRVVYCKPARPFSEREIADMQRYLDSQMGKRYSLRGYVRESPGDGIHCAALVGSAINASGAAKVSNPYRQSPSTLMVCLRSLYSPGLNVRIPTPEIKPTWGERISDACRGFRMWCLWSFLESFRFCF